MPAGQFIGYQPTPSPKALDPAAQAALRNLMQRIPVDPLDQSKGDILLRGADRAMSAEDADALRGQYANQAMNYNANPPPLSGKGFVRNDTTGVSASLADLPAKKKTFSLDYSAVQPSLQREADVRARNQQQADEDAKAAAADASYRKTLPGQRDQAQLDAFLAAKKQGELLIQERNAERTRRRELGNAAFNPAPIDMTGAMPNGKPMAQVKPTLDRSALNMLRQENFINGTGDYFDPEQAALDAEMKKSQADFYKRSTDQQMTPQETMDHNDLVGYAKTLSETDPEAANAMMMKANPRLAAKINEPGQAGTASFFPSAIPPSATINQLASERLQNFINKDTDSAWSRMTKQVPAATIAGGTPGLFTGPFAPIVSGIGGLIGGGTALVNSVANSSENPSDQDMQELKDQYADLVKSLTHEYKGDKATAKKMAKKMFRDAAKGSNQGSDYLTDWDADKTRELFKWIDAQ